MKCFEFSINNYNKNNKNYEKKLIKCIIKIFISIMFILFFDSIDNEFVGILIFLIFIYYAIFNIFKFVYLIFNWLIDIDSKNTLYVLYDNSLYQITSFNNETELSIDKTISKSPNSLKNNNFFKLLVIAINMRKNNKIDHEYIIQNIESILKSPSAYNELFVSRIFKIYSIKEKNNKYEIVCNKLDYKTGNEFIKIKDYIYKYYDNYEELIEIIKSDFIQKN